MVRLPLLSVLMFLLLGWGTIGLPMAAFQMKRWPAFSCAVGYLALLAAGLVSILAAWLRRKAIPAASLAWFVRSAAVLFILADCLYERGGSIGVQEILLLALFILMPLYLLSHLLDAEAKRQASGIRVGEESTPAAASETAPGASQ